MTNLCRCKSQKKQEYWDSRCAVGDGYDWRYDGYHLSESRFIRQTDKSYLVKYDGFEKSPSWVPKSQSVACHQCKEVTISAWLADKIGLMPYI